MSEDFDDVACRRLMAAVCSLAVKDAAWGNAEARHWITTGPGADWLVSLGVIEQKGDVLDMIDGAVARIRNGYVAREARK